MYLFLFFIYKLNVNRFSFNHWIQHLRMCTNHRRILHNWKNKTKSVVLMYQNRKRFTPYQRVEILFDQCRSNRTFHLHVSQMNQSSFLQNNATIHDTVTCWNDRGLHHRIVEVCLPNHSLVAWFFWSLLLQRRRKKIKYASEYWRKNNNFFF